MAEFVIVGSSGAFQLESAANYSLKTTHEGGQTVYYSNSPRVSSTINDGTLTVGQSFTFTGRRFFLTQSGTGTQGSSASLRLDNVPVLGEAVPPPGSVNVLDFGAKGDGTTDDIAAFEAAIADIVALPDPGSIGSTRNSLRGPYVWVPPGTYRWSRPLHPSKQVILQGAGGDAESAATFILVDAGQNGIVIDSVTSDWCELRDFAVRAAGKTSTADGVVVNGHVTMKRVWIRGFQRNGVRVQASTPGSNANLSYFERVTADTNDGDGFYVQGNDANACTFLACNGSTNGGYGFNDQSFLGNSFYMCHSADNVGGSYQTAGNVNGATFHGCYQEGDNLSNIKYPALIFGGTNMGNSQPGATNQAPYLTAGHGSGWLVKPHIGIDLSDGATHTGSVSLGQQDQAQSLIALQLSMDGGTEADTYFKWDPAVSGWTWDWGGAGRVMYLTTRSATETTSAGGVGQVVFPGGIWLGGQAGGGNKITYAAAAPTTGTWKHGDIAFNTGAAASGKVGWVCTAAGTPGVWKAFGVIDA